MMPHRRSAQSLGRKVRPSLVRPTITKLSTLEFMRIEQVYSPTTKLKITRQSQKLRKPPSSRLSPNQHIPEADRKNQSNTPSQHQRTERAEMNVLCTVTPNSRNPIPTKIKQTLSRKSGKQSPESPLPQTDKAEQPETPNLARNSHLRLVFQRTASKPSQAQGTTPPPAPSGARTWARPKQPRPGTATT